MTKSLILASALALAGTFATAQSVPLNTQVQGGAGSEVEVGQAGAALAGSLGAGGLVAIATLVVVIAAASDDDASTTTTGSE